MGHTRCSKANKPPITSRQCAWPTLATICDIFLVSLDLSCQYLFNNIRFVIMFCCAYRVLFFLYFIFFLSPLFFLKFMLTHFNHFFKMSPFLIATFKKVMVTFFNKQKDQIPFLIT